MELKGSIDISKLDEYDSSKDVNRNIKDFDNSGISKVIEGLMSLGWKQSDAQKAVENVCNINNISLPINDSDIPNILRMALSSLDRGR